MNFFLSLSPEYCSLTSLSTLWVSITSRDDNVCHLHYVNMTRSLERLWGMWRNMLKLYAKTTIWDEGLEIFVSESLLCTYQAITLLSVKTQGEGLPGKRHRCYADWEWVKRSAHFRGFPRNSEGSWRRGFELGPVTLLCLWEAGGLAGPFKKQTTEKQKGLIMFLVMIKCRFLLVPDKLFSKIPRLSVAVMCGLCTCTLLFLCVCELLRMCMPLCMYECKAQTLTWSFSVYRGRIPCWIQSLPIPVMLARQLTSVS